MKFFSQKEKTITLKYGDEESPIQFFLRPVLAREQRQMLQKHWSLTAEERAKEQHGYNVQLLTALSVRNPAGLDDFNPENQTLADYLTGTNLEELANIRKQETTPDNLSDEKRIMLINDLKEQLVTDVLNEYYEQTQKKSI